MTKRLLEGDVGYFWDKRDNVFCRVKVLGYETKVIDERYRFEILEVLSRRCVGADGEVYFPKKTINRARPLGKESPHWVLDSDDLSDVWRNLRSDDGRK